MIILLSSWTQSDSKWLLSIIRAVVSKCKVWDLHRVDRTLEKRAHIDLVEFTDTQHCRHNQRRFVWLMTWNVFATFILCSSFGSAKLWRGFGLQKKKALFQNEFISCGAPCRRREESSNSGWGGNSPRKSKLNKWHKVIFQMATVKGAFVYSKICSNGHLTNCSKRKGQMERNTQREGTRCTQWEEGIFWWIVKDVFWGKAASDVLFQQRALV